MLYLSYQSQNKNKLHQTTVRSRYLIFFQKTGYIESFLCFKVHTFTDDLIIKCLHPNRLPIKITSKW